MSPNKIKQYRTQLSMTQRQLAELAHTSQQQIQRIETGKIAANLATAQAICIALGKSLNAVFPGAEKAVSAFRKKVEQIGRYSDEDLSGVADKGVEMDGCAWTLKLYLRGHQDYFILSISNADKRRMYAYLQESEHEDVVQFFVFDSDEYRIALNISEIAFHQFLFDAPGDVYVKEDTESEELDYSNVRITFINGGPTACLSVEPDEPEDEEYDVGQLGHIFYMLESGSAPSERFVITDMDGEDAFIRAGSVAMLQVVFSVLEPDEQEE
ncbi:helix-turn-helix domain-containing protein [Photorhabdus khanii]|uniref:Transcriptional regulator n=1 Tax=Photorhabdus khanii subsp. guanajuatensis TaxID=2100166 RepID=A0A4R4IR26_9GAMM|nr:helix-turn-helix domain-containing protein [Photorhabdus khanii]TDB42619.1 transcriptional regulator [Photorhabdus khanii subsp. guanajuatensis]